MSEPGPAGGSSPLEGLPFFAELAQVPDADGPVHWDVARRVAVWVAGGGRPEPPVDPAQAEQLQQLGRVAELQIAGAVPAAMDAGTSAVTVVAVTRGEWALRALDAERPLLEVLAASLGAARPPDPDSRPAGLAPSVLEGLVFGWMMGQLSRRALGQHDPPLPRPPTSRLSIPLANLDETATEWRLPVDEVRLWACLQDVAHRAVIAVPHVREALAGLVGRYVASFDVAAETLADEIEAVDPTDPTSFRTALGDPEAMVSAVQTPEQAAVLSRLEALAAAMEGWVASVVDDVGGRLLGSYEAIEEAVRRRRAEATWGDRFVARLLGMGLRQPAYERGRRFVTGLVERGGEEALARLWSSPWLLPTPAEVDAPGLWLARIDLPEGG